MIRAVYFDLGGVLLRTEDRAPRTKLAERFGLDYEGIEKIVFGGGVEGSAVQATLGKITEEQHWHNVMDMLKLPADGYKNIEAEFFGGDVLDRALIDFIVSLRPRYKTALISNAWSGLRDYMRRENFLNIFDEVIISAEVGFAKPAPEIYQLALARLEVKAPESIFVDDVLQNITACQKLGMHGVHFRSAGQAMSEVNKLLR